ncbi:MAG: cysteine desulfurase [Frankiaceae bacterium]|nr:cysteine desulfurase [Frankiaceae bacterium]
MPTPGYFDYASTAPLHPAARAALLTAYDDGWADPSRLYGAARRARILLDDARARIGAVIDARPDEVSFTSSGTTSVHAALAGALLARSRAGSRLVASAVEHSSVMAVGTRHADGGGAVDLVPVDWTGRVDLDRFSAAVTGATAVASLQHANHEVGTLQPVAAAAAHCRTVGVPLHVDAAQTVGRIPVSMADLDCSLLSASAHKWGGPAGVGLLVVRKGTRWRSAAPADERESRRVPGFENLPAIIAAAAALEARQRELADEAARLTVLVDRLRSEIPRRVADVEVVGDPVQRLPNLMTFSCLYVAGEALLHALDRAGFAVSSGSSCSSSMLSPSHVLEAMGVLTHGNIRISLGRDTRPDEIESFLDSLPAIVAALRQANGAQEL